VNFGNWKGAEVAPDVLAVGVVFVTDFFDGFDKLDGPTASGGVNSIFEGVFAVCFFGCGGGGIGAICNFCLTLVARSTGLGSTFSHSIVVNSADRNGVIVFTIGSKAALIRGMSSSPGTIRPAARRMFRAIWSFGQLFMLGIKLIWRFW